MAHILCFLWKEGGGVTFGEGHRLSPASMYADMVNYIWLRFLEKVGEEKAKRKEVFTTLEVIAFDALCDDRILINLNFVERREDSLNVKKVLRHSGFLLFKKEGLDYQFPHLTFQEYFAAKWLEHSLKKSSTSDEHQKALDFLREEKYLKRYRTTLMFLAQQLAEKQGVDGLSELLSNLDEEPMEIIGLQHLFLKLYIIEAWLTGLEEKSKIEDCCDCEPIASMIGASMSLITNTATNYREFSKILGSLLRQCPVLFGAVPKMLDCLTNSSTMIRNTVRHDVFGEVVRVAKHSPGHLERLVDEAHHYIKSLNLWERYTGMDMLRELMDCAPQLSTDLLSLCETILLDETFRRQGVSLQAVISVLPDGKNMSSEMLALFERTIANPNRFVRQSVMEAIGSFASATAEQCSRVSLIIERGCEDEDEDVCREALRAMRRFVPEQTFQVANLVPVVERLACGKNEEIRRETIKTIECTGRKSPQVWTLLPPICHSMCLTEEARVRRDATEMTGRLAASIPQLRSDLLPLIERGCTDESAIVRVAGLWAIKLLAARSSENANDMLRIAAAGYEDENASVRRTAMEAISRLASASHLSEDIMSLVKKGCLDEDVHVRLWAVDALGQLSSVAPHLSEDILALLRERCFEANCHVRQWSMEAVGHLASAAPDLAGDILPLARVGCSDGDAHVRLWALKTVSRLAEAAPQLLEDLLPLLRDVDVSEDTHMMNRANEAMRAVSSATTAHLSGHLLGASESECATDRSVRSKQGTRDKTTSEFEDTLREAIETMQEEKLYQTARLLLYEAVTLEKSKRSGFNRVVLHSTDKTVVGEYPVEQFDQFVSSVAMFRDTFHGGLLNALLELTTKKPEKDR